MGYYSNNFFFSYIYLRVKENMGVSSQAHLDNHPLIYALCL